MSSTGRSTLLPAAPVEPPATAAVPVEQVAQKRKATSPLPPRISTRPTSPSSPTRWEIARSRIKGRFEDYITPPFDNIAYLPRKPACPDGRLSQRKWVISTSGWWRMETDRCWCSPISTWSCISRLFTTRLSITK